MSEREISFETFRPLLGKGITLPQEPFTTRYVTLTAENEKKLIQNFPVKIGGMDFPMPTVEINSNLQLTDVIFEVKDEVDKLKTIYGDIPIGGMEIKTFKTITGKPMHTSISLPVEVDTFEQEVLQRKIISIVEEERREEAEHIANHLPKAAFHEDKGLMFQISGEPLLTLTPHGPVINKELSKEADKINLNFLEGMQNQKLLPYEDCFIFEYVLHQSDQPLNDENGNEKDVYLIAGIKFPKSVDFNFINTFIKTYTEYGGKITESLIREYLFNPYIKIVLKDHERDNK